MAMRVAATEMIDGTSSPWAPLEGVPVALLVTDACGRILFGNTSAERTFRCGRSQLFGARIETFFAPDCRAAWQDALATFLATRGCGEEPLRASLTGVRMGQPFPIEASLGGLTAARDSVTIVVRDVSGEDRAPARRSGAAAAARDARDRLEALLAFAPAFILCVNKEGIIEFINKTLPQYTRAETIGSSWLKYFPLERHALMSETLKDVFDSGSIRSYEVSTAGADGVPVYFESRIAPMYGGGDVIGAVLVSQDVTERKRAQAELLAGRPMVLLGTLAAGIAHEINTPIQFLGDSIHFLRTAANDLLKLVDTLRALRGDAEAPHGSRAREVVEASARAEDDADLPYLRATIPEAFETCISGLVRVSSIVRSLKDFAHPSAEEMVPADLNRAVQSALTIAANEYKYVADVQTYLGEIPPVTCRLDEISQAILNIIVNAAHAIQSVVSGTDRKGLITVRTSCDADWAMISITDTGDGIPEDIQSRVFDPFFTTKEVGKGTGQGLAIAHASVNEHHGGQLTFETSPGHGTTFLIRLPLAGDVKAVA
jgi:PAS domain S-box-containing protein